MKTYQRPLYISSTLGLLLAISAGCASAPTLGDRMQERGELASQLGDDWKRGSKLVKQAEKLKEQGAKLSKESAEKLAKAEQLLSEGQQLMRQSEASFSQQFPSGSEVQTASGTN